MRLVCLAATALVCSVVAAQEIPRPEYPQPQFQREQWQTLNGQWEFEFDDRDQGIAQNWSAADHKLSKSILVPFCFESKKSGIGDTSFHPVVWYRRTFQVPAAWNGKRTLLHFGAVDYRATVWVNGRVAGSHEGGSVPFRFDISPFLKAGGPNVVTVRAEDPPTDRYIPRGKQYWEPKSRGIFYTRTTGIWQPVWIEAAGQSWLDRVRSTTTLDGSVQFEALVEKSEPGTEFHAIVRSGTTPVASGMGIAEGPRAAAAAMVRNPRLWSVNTPNLYEVTFELRRNGQVLDKVESYIGFRTVGVEGKRVTINNRPVYLKLVLDQGYWPESTLTPPTDEAMKFDIQMMKDMGFNGARKHQKLEDPRFLYWADKMGFLVSSEAANAYLFDEGYVERFTKEWTESVNRDYSHPSIIMWVPVNESWGTPNVRDARQQQHLRSMYTLTKSLDATRLVIDNDGWEHTEMTDLMAIHDYAPRGDLLEKKYGHLKGIAGEEIPDNARKAMAPGNKYNGTLLYLSEFGGISYLMPGQMAPEGAWGYSGLEKDQAAATDRLTSLWKSIGKLPFAGICYTQLTDVEQEINGLMTYDRKPKFDVKAVKALNDLLQ